MTIPEWRERDALNIQTFAAWDYCRVDLADSLNLTTAVWNQAIRQLKDQGLVIQQGGKRGARYRLA